MALRILMYHAIGERGETATRFVLPVDAFARQMRILAMLPVPILPLEAAVGSLLRGEKVPRGAIALTFDDGTVDIHKLALPILRRHALPATAFVVTQVMGSTVYWTEHPGIAGREIMTWSQALELEPLVTIQPHTRTHASLRGLRDEELVEEIAGSRADVEHQTGHRAQLFAYPYGHYDARVAEATATAGYAAACSVKPGLNDSGTPPYELRRHEVRGDITLRGFLSLLMGRS